MIPATILIVDDEVRNCRVLEAMLRPEGYATVIAANSDEALASIARHAPDLILLDIMLPGMSGCLLANQLKADPATANIPIIMVTALADREACLGALDAGAEEFLTKPVDKAELRPRVRNLLRLKALADQCFNHGVDLEHQVLERTSELRRFRSAMDATADAIMMVNRSTLQFVEANATACTMLGYSRDELFALGPARLGGFESRELGRVYDRIIAGGGTNQVDEVQFRRKDGTHFLGEIRRYAKRHDADWIIVGVVRDITDRRKGDAKFKELLESAPDAMVIVDGDGTIVLVNSQAVTLFGWSREELLGNHIEILVPQRFRGRRPGHPNDFSAQSHPREMGEGQEFFGLRKDGSEFPVEISLSPLATDEGALLIRAIRDVTVRKEGENRIKRLNRVYAVLSGINAAIARVRDKDELFKATCRIAVQDGRFRAAVVGIVDRETTQLRIVAEEGIAKGFLEALRPRMHLGDDAPEGFGAGPAAIRGKVPVVINDVQSDPRVLRKKECIEHGVHSIAVLPLLIADEAVGVLTLFGGEPGFFDEEEMRLLTELAGDVAYAIDHVDKQARLDYLAYYDSLTGLANRALFHERLEQGMAIASEQHRKVALLLVDIERFKGINDTLGRAAGDKLLKMVAARMLQYAVGGGRLARIDGDHFAVIYLDLQTDEEVARRLELRIAEVFEPPFHVGETDVRISAKIGIAMSPGDGADADTLFRNCEAALMNAKASGNRYLFYAQSMNQHVAEKFSLEHRLRHALDKGEFVLHYQPKVNLASGKLTGAEALIRWNDPRAGLVAPGRFIPILEETGLINPVGRWALRQAIADYLRWRAMGLPAVRIAVNVSSLQLRNRDFVGEIRQVLSVDAHAARGLELEITESLIMEDVKHSTANLASIRAMGVTIAVDDFGTGFSSLSILSKLPVDTLKVDRSFVVDMTAGPQGLALVSTIINLAHSLELKVVAEGVETEEQSRLLRLLGCDEMQGFLFSKPLPIADFEDTFLALPA